MMELKPIASFQVDHTKLTEGMYISRVDGDVVTYDIRMVRPNCGTYLGYGAIHSFEHLFATYVRSGPLSGQVIYAGPMGCRTGFYFLVRDMAPETAIRLVRETMAFIADYQGPIPGATEAECGNYREQDLEGARAAARKMLPILKDWTVEKLAYYPSAAPDLETCEAYVDNPFWGELRTYLERAYDTAPVWEYSRCVPTGWNIKYRKGGRGLCTLYPMRGYFTALVVIGRRERPGADLLLPMLSEGTRRLWQDTREGMGQKWLMIDVADRESLEDVKRLIALRRAPVRYWNKI